MAPDTEAPADTTEIAWSGVKILWVETRRRIASRGIGHIANMTDP
jgi:hypothetical protein